MGWPVYTTADPAAGNRAVAHAFSRLTIHVCGTTTRGTHAAKPQHATTSEPAISAAQNRGCRLVRASEIKEGAAALEAVTQ